MTKLIRKIFLSIVGLLCGIACWPFVELLVSFQSFFPSYFIFSITLGIVVGVIMGAFFSSFDFITGDSKDVFFGKVVSGKIIGALGGAVGFLVAQFILFVLGAKLLQINKSFEVFVMPVAKSSSWLILGLFLGSIEGIRSKSLKKLTVGIIGGVIGGFLGGLILEFLLLAVANSILARLIGLCILGLFIAFFLSLIEETLATGVLRLLNGSFKGREYLINQRKIKVGRAKDNDIVLSDFAIMDDYHALFESKKRLLFVKNLSKSTPVKVNDENVIERELKHEDVLKIGSAKFLFKYR